MLSSKVDTELLRDTVQDCNINFLMGSGLSRPYLSTLGNIETLLTDLSNRENVDAAARVVIRGSILKRYFDEVMGRNIAILNSDEASLAVQAHYETLLRTLNSIMLHRSNTLLTKEVNLFTTNIDIFIEKALDHLGLEFNDGFSGRFKPSFSISNFKKTHYKRSLHYDNMAELPVFNLCKLHGSLSWLIKDSRIAFSYDLSHVGAVSKIQVPQAGVIDIPNDATLDRLLESAHGVAVTEQLTTFLSKLEDLLVVVNPTKDKFRHTLMNQTYYELLRIYSNELEKENSVLFAIGFSFEDEHIREITLRAANSNPTLSVYVFCHTTASRNRIASLFPDDLIRNNNINFVAPEQRPHDNDELRDDFDYDLANLNSRVFGKILTLIEQSAASAAAH